MHDNNSLAHTSWNCKYHIVFAPKYGRKIFYDNNKAEIGKILRELCEWKGVRINRGRSMSRPYTYVSGDTTQTKCIRFYGFFKRKEQYNNTPKTRKFKI